MATCFIHPFEQFIMRSRFLYNSLVTGFIATLIISVYSRMLDVVASTGIDKQIIFMLGVISIVIMPLAMYFGLRRLRYLKSKPLRLVETIGTGLLMVLVTAVSLIIVKVFLIFFQISEYDSLGQYVQSKAPFMTLFWFTSLGLVYSFLLHIIIHFQFKKHENKISIPPDMP